MGQGASSSLGQAVSSLGSADLTCLCRFVLSKKWACKIIYSYAWRQNGETALKGFTKYLQQRKMTMRMMTMISKILNAAKDGEDDDDDES